MLFDSYTGYVRSHSSLLSIEWAARYSLLSLLTCPPMHLFHISSLTCLFVGIIPHDSHTLSRSSFVTSENTFPTNSLTFSTNLIIFGSGMDSGSLLVTFSHPPLAEMTKITEQRDLSSRLVEWQAVAHSCRGEKIWKLGVVANSQSRNRQSAIDFLTAQHTVLHGSHQSKAFILREQKITTGNIARRLFYSF